MKMEEREFQTDKDAFAFILANYRLSVTPVLAEESTSKCQKTVYGFKAIISAAHEEYDNDDGDGGKENADLSRRFKLQVWENRECSEYRKFVKAGKSRMLVGETSRPKRACVKLDKSAYSEALSDAEDDAEDDVEEFSASVQHNTVHVANNDLSASTLQNRKLEEIDKTFAVPKPEKVTFHSHEINERDEIHSFDKSNFSPNNLVSPDALKMIQDSGISISDDIPVAAFEVSISRIRYLNEPANLEPLVYPFELVIKKMMLCQGVPTDGYGLYKFLSRDPTIPDIVKYDGDFELKIHSKESRWFAVLPNQMVVCFLKRNCLNLVNGSGGTYNGWIPQLALSELGYRSGRVSRHQVSFPGTFEYPETFTGDLHLELRPYQKRSISWMLSIENPHAEKDEILKTRSIIHKESRNQIEIIPDSLYFIYYWGSYKFSCLPDPDASVDYRGGILADDTGTGKTITMLYLIHQNPFLSYENVMWDNAIQKHYYIPSTATLIIAPPNLIRQWYNECIKLYGPKSGKKIYLFNTVLDYDRLTWNDVLTADIIIASHRFLSNKNYKIRLESKLLDSSVPQHMRKLIELTRSAFGSQKHWPLDGIYWHRVVYDEIHEIEFRTKACKTRIKSIRGSWYWGLTGTPAKASTFAVTNMCKWLNCDSLNLNAEDLINKVIKRNVPNLELPPLSLEEIFITLTDSERALLSSLSSETNDDIETMLKLCSHHQISDQVVNVTGASTSNPLSSEEVNMAVQSSRLVRINATEIEISRSVQALDHFVERLNRGDFEVLEDKNDNSIDLSEFVGQSNVRIESENADVKPEPIDSVFKVEAEVDDFKIEPAVEDVVVKVEADAEVKKKKKPKMTKKQIADYIANSKRHITMTKNDLKKLVSEYNYFNGMLKLLNEDEETLSCSICLGNVGKKSDKMSCITRCGHIFCHPCLLEWNQPKCPTCRTAISMQNDVFVVAPKEKEAESSIVKVEDDKEEEKYAKYGSKVKRLVEYILQCISENSTNRIILFTQFQHLSNLVFAALEEFEIKIVRVFGNISCRNKAIREFEASNDIRVIMLSAEDSVSGLNLVMATHIILVHPFYHGKDKEDESIAAEKQGIARAYRSGLEHPLKVVRLITRGTIEEKIYSERVGKTVFGSVSI